MYSSQAASSLQTKQGSAGGGGIEGPDRIFVDGMPYYFTEAQFKEVLEAFGPLRSFEPVEDRETGNSKAAFCVYHNVSVTDIACTALNGIQMGERTLTVRRANHGEFAHSSSQRATARGDTTTSCLAFGACGGADASGGLSFSSGVSASWRLGASAGYVASSPGYSPGAAPGQRSAAVGAFETPAMVRMVEKSQNSNQSGH
ncbi:hypothetical protein M0R45_013887 [Rubus argutus]|uniref:RRM domain-containing protein n=1 Tax=Rubus argutus TaxID=59490 RepID=A0AAW1XJS6_RUBAR